MARKKFEGGGTCTLRDLGDIPITYGMWTLGADYNINRKKTNGNID